MKAVLMPLAVGVTALIFAAVHTGYLYLRPYWTQDLWSVKAQLAQWVSCLIVSGAAFWAMVRKL